MARNRLYSKAKERAAKKGIPFVIAPQDIIVPKYCPILGIEMESHHVPGGLSNSPTLDRRVNSRGYVSGNVWVISRLANQMKSNASPEQLLNFADWVYAEYGWIRA